MKSWWSSAAALAAVTAFLAGACGGDDANGIAGGSGAVGAANTGGNGGLADSGSGGGSGTDGGAGSDSGAEIDSAASGGASGALGTGGGAGAGLVCSLTGPKDCSDPGASTWNCADKPTFHGKVLNNAIEQVLAAHPTWFDYSSGAPCCPVALEPKLFIDAVVAAVGDAGLCSTPSPLAKTIEVVVKLNNQCEESWAVLTTAKVVRHPPHHQSTCTAVP